MAGLLNWSYVWCKPQPEIAKRIRVCAFDRASFGFSDPAPRPQILSDTWYARHEALAHLSSRGVYRFIEGSGHAIQLEKPQVVIDAVDDVLRQLHIGAKP